MKILLIDSKKSHCLKIKKIVETAIPSCLVSIKDTGLEGVSEMHNSDYDVAILCDNLSDGQATEILPMLCQNEHHRPVVAIFSERHNANFEIDPVPGNLVTLINEESFEKTLLLALTELHKRYQLYLENSRLFEGLCQAKSNQKIAEIASNCNHKINNPLMTILGNTQLLLRDCNECDEKSIMRLEKIERAAKKIQEITLILANNIGVESRPLDLMKTEK